MTSNPYQGIEEPRLTRLLQEDETKLKLPEGSLREWLDEYRATGHPGFYERFGIDIDCFSGPEAEDDRKELSQAVAQAQLEFDMNIMIDAWEPKRAS